MTDRPKDQPPFDERAALTELERFRSEIERYRRQRQAVHQEFEDFVSSMPSPESVFPSEATTVTPAKPPEARRAPTPATPEAPAAPVTPANATVRKEPTAQSAGAPPRSTASPRPAVAPASGVPRFTEVDSAPVAAAQAAAPKRSRAPLLIVALLLAGGAGFWAWSAQRSGSPPERSDQAPIGQESPAPAPQPAETAPAAPAAPPVITESVVTTTRPVWVRVIADGERVVERELPADARVPFNAEKTIVIRTGDAGAVRLSIRGEDQGVLGRDGQVVTRTIDVPAKPPR